MPTAAAAEEIIAGRIKALYLYRRQSGGGLARS